MGVTCERVKIDRMGYTTFGRYFGPVNTRDSHNLMTAPVFLCEDEDSGISEYLRAFDAADAKRRFLQALTRTTPQPSLWQRSSPTLVSLRRRYATWPHFVEALDEYADIVIPDTVPVVYVATSLIPLPPQRPQSAMALKREEAHAGKMVHAMLRGDDMPPVLLNMDGTIHDGRARLVAALRTGLPYVPVVNIGPYRRVATRADTRGEVSLVPSKIVGFKSAAKALDRSRHATTSPRVISLPDGTYVGVGDENAEGDAMLFGARGTSAWRSTVALSRGAQDEFDAIAAEAEKYT